MNYKDTVNERIRRDNARIEREAAAQRIERQRAFFQKHKYVRRAFIVFLWVTVVPAVLIFCTLWEGAKAAWDAAQDEWDQCRELYRDSYRDGWHHGE